MRRALLVLLALAACGDNSGPSASSGTTALFSLTAGNGSGGSDNDFYALPYPNDLRRTADGTLDLSLFPVNSPIAQDYVAAAQTLDGFGLNAAMFARFDGPLDPTTLPDPAGSIKPGAAVYLVNVDKASPDYNTRTPLTVDFVGSAGGTIGANRIAVRPYPGFPLDEATTYALVFTTRIHDVAGDAVAPNDTFTDTLTTSAAYAPLLAWLGSSDADDKAADLASAAVFTTQHATFVADALRKAIYATPAPVALTTVGGNMNATYHLYTGSYTAPNFQSGPVPYHNSPDGEIHIGSDGLAIVQVPAEPMRYALTIPTTPMPAAGYPFAVYAHGTGGDYESFVDDGTAGRLAQQGIAVISTDQVLHGPRNPGGDAEVDFFNIANPYAARDNALQGAADAFSQLRLIEGMSVADGSGSDARTAIFDPANAMFFGHSQGGLTGPPFVAYEPSLKGAVLSGTGGLLYLAMLYKTEPVDFPTLIEPLLRDDPVDEDNASIALAQMWVERSDGANYAPLMVRKPPNGEAPRSIFQSEGYTDTYCPNPAIEAFATSLGGDIVMTANSMPVEGVTLRGRTIVAPPVMKNLNGATAVLAQYNMKPGSDGHFVVFEIPAAEEQSAQFLGTLAATGVATVVVPQ
jgi:hypothetical protein